MTKKLSANTSKALDSNEIGHATNKEISELITILVTHEDDIKKFI
jgi:hypothetical protein